MSAPTVQGVDWGQTYPVCVTDETASPRYLPGDTLHVHPDRPFGPGDWVLIVRRAPGDASPISIAAKLLALDGKAAIFQQLNPASVQTLEVGNIVSINRIVGSSEAGS